ncbi:MAG: hypothetical protein HUJ51_03295, partial [Eggerthellaceae bacterium]|nr:hypothetical protein [Eggerthellaceae bacterium]
MELDPLTILTMIIVALFLKVGSGAFIITISIAMSTFGISMGYLSLIIGIIG